MNELENKALAASMQSGSPVLFRLGDAICPETEQVLRQMSPDARVCGEIVFFSDCGDERAHFAIISAVGIDTPLVVPVTRLEHLGVPQSRNPDQRPDAGGTPNRN